MKICITGIGGPAGVGVSKYLSKEGHWILGVDVDPQSAGRKFTDSFQKVPTADSNNFISELVKICDRNDIDMIIPTIDDELSKLAASTKLFNEIDTTVVVSDPKTVETATDKLKFAEKMSEMGFVTPKTWRPADISDQQIVEELPLIIKPKRGRGSRNVFICDRVEQVKYALKMVEIPVIQEYIQGIEYTIDTLSTLDGKPICAVSRVRCETKGGISWKGKTVNDPELCELAKEVVSSLNCIGPTNLQVIQSKQKDKNYIIELNPRFGGTTSLSIEAGVNTPKLLIDLVEDNQISAEQLSYDELYLARYFEDVIFTPKKIKEPNTTSR